MIVTALILGFILRLISLNQSFWLDEATSATVARSLNFSEIVTQFAPNDFHPPLYYLLLNVWSLPFGVSEIWARVLSVLFALGTIYVVYLIGKKIKSENLGTIAAILVATAPLHVYYSQEARMYSMEAFLVSLGVYLFLKEKWIFFSIALALIGLTDYLPLLIIPAFWIFGVVSKKSIPWFTKLILSHVPLALCYALWSPFLLSQLRNGLSVRDSGSLWWQVLGSSNIKELLLVPVKFMIGRISFDSNIIYGLVVGFTGLVFAFIFYKSKKFLKENILIYLWLLVPIILAFLISFKISVFSYFRFLFVLPAFYLILAFGVSSLKKKVYPILFLLIIFLNLAFSLAYLLNSKFHREDWRGLVSTVGDDPIVFPAKSQREAFLYYSDNPNIIEAEKLDKNQKTLWLSRYVQDITDPGDITRLKIEELGYKKTNDYNFNGVVIWKYER